MHFLFEQAALVQFFVKLLSSQKDDNWPLPIMYTVCLDLRLFAGKADSQLSSKGGKPGETLEKVIIEGASTVSPLILSVPAIEVLSYFTVILIVVHRLRSISCHAFEHVPLIVNQQRM